MTELRGAVRQRVLDAINDCGREKLQCRQTGADKATDAIMALFAGGSGALSGEQVYEAERSYALNAKNLPWWRDLGRASQLKYECMAETLTALDRMKEQSND